MKTLYYFFLAIIFAVTICSCDNKRDPNGDLGGFWIMTSWNEKAEDTIRTNPGIYYSVQLKLMKFHNSQSAIHYYLSYFKQTKDSLFIHHIVDYPNDTLCSTSVLKEYGVPENGAFQIQILNDKHLVLTCPERTLTFRKY